MTTRARPPNERAIPAELRQAIVRALGAALAHAWRRTQADMGARPRTDHRDAALEAAAAPIDVTHTRAG